MIQFGTGGFRGVIGNDFIKENIQKIAQALADISKEELNDKPIVVGFDYRFLSDIAAEWISEVLVANGISVLLMDSATPTPEVMFAVKDEVLNYGVMITASHNPYNYNGIKLFLKGGVDADVAFTSKMEKIINNIKTVKTIPLNQAKAGELIKSYNNMQKYLRFIQSFISDKVKNNTAKILYDNLNGVGTICLSQMAKNLQIKQFDILHERHDAFFNFALPNPTKEMMAPLSDIVKKEHYDFAMATDSDGDRLGVLDENGNYVDSNTILGILYYYLCKYRGEKGDIVKNCATSLLLDKLAEKLGYCCHEVDVGFKNISKGMTDYDALIGGESSGGLTVRGYIKGKDSVFSASLFMEAVIVIGKPVSEIVKEVRAFAGYTLCAEEASMSLPSLDNIKNYLLKNTPAISEKVLEMKHFGSNYKYDLETGWVLIRLSGTEPVVRIGVETESQEKTDNIINELSGELRKYA
jgi:phosphoglucomutase